MVRSADKYFGVLLMDGKMIDLTGYHGTCSNCIESIEKHGLDPDQVKIQRRSLAGTGCLLF